MSQNDKPTAAADSAVLPGELGDSIAPAPTRSTIRMRTFLPYQVYRFARVNLRMAKMIRRSHVH
ncbi:hypothetical protein [Nocardioides sp.]|uniref:hypothetical protein n=1 Tax=Nocardioides sp. TaxID=35761 RepID=UPI0037835BCC